MESMKAYLPDVIHARVDDLINAQTVDEEIAAHMRELESCLEDLQALAGKSDAESALSLVEDVGRLCARIRRDFVELAYRQGLLDGDRMREALTETLERATDSVAP